MFSTRKADFLTEKSVFLVWKLIFSMRKQLFQVHTSVHGRISLPNISNRETRIPLFHSKICQAPFSYGDPPYGNGDWFFLIPIWKRGFPISIWGCVNPRFHTICMEMFTVAEVLAMQWRLVRDSMAGQNSHFHTGSPHMQTLRQTKKFLFGESPFPNRVCARLGINTDNMPVFERNTTLCMTG